MVDKGLLVDMADYAERERRARLSADVIHHAKRAVIDCFAALLAGGNDPPATLLARAFGDSIGHGKALLYPSGRKAPLRLAALINATAAHTAEFDDIFRDAIYHPGAPTIPAALAAAQSRGADGMAFLRAVVVGYEISTRIGLALGRPHYRYWHTTATVGTFGSAAAVATLLGLDRMQFAHALATAATMAAGLQQAFRSEAMSKPLHAGHAAEAGALAAVAAGEGVTGALDVLDGAAGLGAAMAGGTDWSGTVVGLGRDYNITQMTFKNHGCCGHSFAAIDAILALRAAHNLTAEKISKITVRTYKTALDVTGSYKVTTSFEGRFSLPYVAATALVHGRVRIDAFEPKRLADPAVRALMQKVELAVDPVLDAGFPGQRAAHVEIATTDGRQLRHEQPTRKGDPDLPLSDDELSDKLLELASPAVGAAQARRLLQRLWSLDRAGGAAMAIESACSARRGHQTERRRSPSKPKQPKRTRKTGSSR